jgi:hypothetical protein
VFPEPKLFERRTIITQDDENRPTPLPKGSSGKGYIHPYPLNEDILSSCAPTSPFMTGMRIYINPDTDISDAMRSVLEECINAAGARLLDKESTYSSENVDIYIGRWRFGEEYKQASIDGTIVGSIWWLSNTLARNRIESPTRTLLDYPLPKSGITEMQNMVCLRLILEQRTHISIMVIPSGNNDNKLQWRSKRLCSSTYTCSRCYIYPQLNRR